MNQPEVIRMTLLNGTSRVNSIVRRDLKTPNRIYCQFPAYASLTHDEAIALANRLADVLEDNATG